MKRKFIAMMLATALTAGIMSGCGASEEAVVQEETATEETASAEVEETAAEEAAAEEAAAKEAEANEHYEAGRVSLYGLDGQKKDLEAAYTHFERALELGKTEANFYLGVLYDWESYPEEDFEKARSYYEAAGENPYAYVSLGFYI